MRLSGPRSRLRGHHASSPLLLVPALKKNCSTWTSLEHVFTPAGGPCLSPVPACNGSEAKPTRTYARTLPASR